MRTSDALDVLRRPGFRALFIAQTVSLFGDAMVTVALAFAVLDLTGSVSDLGLVLMARLLPLVLLLLVGGVVGDRVSRRVVMASADATRCCSQGVLAALLLTHHATIGAIAALQVVHGFASAFFQPASTGLLPMVVADRQLQPANALRGLALSASGIGGPALAGALVAGFGSGWAIAVDSATFFVSGLFVLRIPGITGTPASAASFVADLRDGWREFSSRTWVWTVVLAASFGNMLASPFQVLGPYIAKHDLGGATSWGFIAAAVGVGSVVGGIAMLRSQPRRPLLVGCSLLGCFSLPLFALALRLPTPAIAATALAFGLGVSVFNGLWETSLQLHVPAAALSRVSAYDWFGSFVFAPLGLALVGPIAAAIGATATLWGSGGLILVATLPLLLVPSIRQLPGPADGESGAAGTG